MSQVLVSQIKTFSKEQDSLKKRFRELDKKLILLEKYAKHTKDIVVSRKQTKNGELVSQEKVLHKLGL